MRRLERIAHRRLGALSHVRGSGELGRHDGSLTSDFSPTLRIGLCAGLQILDPDSVIFKYYYQIDTMRVAQDDGGNITLHRCPDLEIRSNTPKGSILAKAPCVLLM
jgi:hypothetical protein